MKLPLAQRKGLSSLGSKKRLRRGLETNKDSEGQPPAPDVEVQTSKKQPGGKGGPRFLGSSKGWGEREKDKYWGGEERGPSVGTGGVKKKKKDPLVSQARGGLNPTRVEKGVTFKKGEQEHAPLIKKRKKKGERSVGRQKKRKRIHGKMQQASEQNRATTEKKGSVKVTHRKRGK